jgi:hypothetical protein
MGARQPQVALPAAADPFFHVRASGCTEQLCRSRGCLADASSSCADQGGAVRCASSLGCSRTMFVGGIWLLHCRYGDARRRVRSIPWRRLQSSAIGVIIAVIITVIKLWPTQVQGSVLKSGHR